MTARYAAYETLLYCEKNSAYSNIAVDSTIKANSFEKRDASLYTMLVYGTISKRITLDFIISSLCGKNVKRLDLPVVLLLRLGIYQIKYCDKIPNEAAVSETVKMASRYASRAKGFINALMRKACDFEPVFDNADMVEYLSCKYSVSKDICISLIKDYTDAENILSAFDNVLPITVAVNPIKCSVQEFLNMTEGCEKGSYSSFSVKLAMRTSVVSMDEFKNGYCTVQDEASQIASEVLEAVPGMTVADVCSCPGGKSFYTAFKMNNEGKIYSFDLHKSKLSLIESGAERLGIGIIQTSERDARYPSESLFEKADRVICDVPCSGIGVIGKKPDLRYKTSDELDSLPPLQLEILNASSRYLKKGGIIVYSTCTLNKKENEAVANEFLATHPEFEAYDFNINGISSSGGMLTLLPHIHNTDGFFIARFLRK